VATNKRRKGLDMILPKNLANVTLKKIEEPITGKIGLSWIYHCMKHFGLNKMVEQAFDVSKNSNREIPAWEKIMTGSLMMIAGGNRVEDIKVLRADQALVNSLGWNHIISPDTYLNFLGEKSTTIKLTTLLVDTVITTMKKSTCREFTYDNDATYFDSEKKCAMFSYQKKQQMSALLGFFPELNGLCVTAQYRKGNVSPAKGILNQLKAADAMAEQAGKKITIFRSDSAAHNRAIFQYCDKRGIKYFVSLDKNIDVLNEISEIKSWKKLEKQPEKEWAEFIYVMVKSKKKKVTMRAMVLRWDNPDPTLFDESPYCYHVIATNDMEIDPMDWLDTHNGRMNSENFNKEIKTGFSCDYTPSNDFNKSCNYFLVGLMAYNMVQIMQLFYLGVEAQSWTIKTLRYWFVYTCGKLTKHARQIACNIINSTDLTFNLFENCLSKLVLSTS
jgi:hypothetical protein